MEEVFALSYKETPNYGKLRHLLTVPLLEMNEVPKSCVLGKAKEDRPASDNHTFNSAGNFNLPIPTEAEALPIATW